MMEVGLVVKMKKILLTLILGMFLISLVSSTSIGTVKQNTAIELTQTCSNCTYVNLTKILYPNNIHALLGEFSMTKNGTNFNYSFSDTNNLGNYVYSTCGDLNGIVTCQSVSFEVTPSGRSPPGSGEGFVFFGSLTIMFFFSILFLLVSNLFKVEEETRSDGNGGNVILRKGHAGFRFGFIGISLVFAMISVLFVSVSLSELFPGFEKISGSYYIFLYVVLATLFLIVLFVLISLIFQSLDHWNIKTGRKDP